MILTLALLLGAAPAAQTRCGWIENPTPANWSLVDRAGEWTISEQGGYQAENDDMPDMTRSGWVVTNAGEYGYGCGCVTGTFDRASKRVVAVKSAAGLALHRCRADRSLPKP